MKSTWGSIRRLGDAAQTTIILVTRAERGSVREAARTSVELRDLGLGNQLLAVNGVFTATNRADAVAMALEKDQSQMLDALPEGLAGPPRAEVAFRSYYIVGLAPLRALLADAVDQPTTDHAITVTMSDLPRLESLIDDLAQAGKGLVMLMGKGGVGKTTIAAAIAVGLAKRGHSVHLTTTDPAAHVSFVVDGTMPGLTVERIDPEAETLRYVDKVMSSKGRDLDDEGKALLREDLASPCTEEVAVFHAVSRTVTEARSAFVVMIQHLLPTPCCCWMPQVPITARRPATLTPMHPANSPPL